MDKALAEIVELANHYDAQRTWQERDEYRWLAGIVEELGELAEALDGKHEHPPETEIKQIASVSINFLRWWYRNKQ